MTEALYDLTVVIGRFQPLHNEHIGLIQYALELGNETLVLIGSADQSGAIKNPFSYEVRRDMIEQEFAAEVEAGLLHVDGIEDFKYQDDIWYAKVVETISHYADASKTVAIVACKKDKTTADYLEEFDITFEEYPLTSTLGATSIRTLMYGGIIAGDDVIPGHVQRKIYKYTQEDPHYDVLCKEWAAVLANKASWSGSPFPPVFVAVDGIVIHVPTEQVLLIKRGNEFGTGKWAMPGGYLDVTETLFDSCLRELREETGFTDDDDTFLQSVAVYDSPDRSLRGRMITHVHTFLCGAETPPEVTPGDDAQDAFWFPIADLIKNKQEFFSDHFHIIAKELDLYEV